MSDQSLNIQLRDFKTVNLKSLNAKACLLKRVERKYLLNSSNFVFIIEDLRKNFDILEINGKRVFNYDNIYMDTDDFLFYNQHQKKIDSRIKVRTRLYIESNLAYFEIKHKLNGITNKYRYEFPVHEHGFITKGKKRFFDGIWQSIYSNETPILSPSIRTNYRRITMVSKKGGERLTIDFDISATNLREKESTPINLKNLIIIEVKSVKDRSIADSIMENHQIEKATNCSKYSLGLIYLGLAEKYDTFKETIQKIGEIRMETVKKTRRKRETGKTSLDKMIKKMKIDTIKRVNLIIT